MNRELLQSWLARLFESSSLCPREQIVFETAARGEQVGVVWGGKA